MIKLKNGCKVCRKRKHFFFLSQRKKNKWQYKYSHQGDMWYPSPGQWPELSPSSWRTRTSIGVARLKLSAPSRTGRTFDEDLRSSFAKRKETRKKGCWKNARKAKNKRSPTREAIHPRTQRSPSPRRPTCSQLVLDDQRNNGNNKRMACVQRVFQRVYGPNRQNMTRKQMKKMLTLSSLNMDLHPEFSISTNSLACLRISSCAGQRANNTPCRTTGTNHGGKRAGVAFGEAGGRRGGSEQLTDT